MSPMKFLLNIHPYKKVDMNFAMDSIENKMYGFIQEKEKEIIHKTFCSVFLTIENTIIAELTAIADNDWPYSYSSFMNFWQIIKF